ncbi:MAG: hypothetical protein SPL08_02070 [Pseudomonadota bacterium]|nr:hypothetical protein [Pseudomonadota bacterium]
MQKIINQLINKRYWIALFIFAIGMFFLNSHAGYPFRSLDRPVYQYVGKVMLSGQIPYRDVFDHKGPLVYFWHVLGTVGNLRWMELILWLSTLFYAFKLLLRLTNPLISLATICFVFSSIQVSRGIGNTEDLSLFFLLIALDTFCAYILKHHLTRTNGFLLGLSVAALLWIKPIHLIMPAVLGTYAFCIGCRRKDTTALYNILLPAIASFSAVTASVISFFAYHHALGALWDKYAIFNFLYTQERTSWAGTDKAFFRFITFPLIFLPTASLLLLSDKAKPTHQLILPLYVAFVATFGMIIMPGRTPPYYFMIIIPLSLALIALEIDALNTTGRKLVYALFGFISLLGMVNLYRAPYTLITDSEKALSTAIQKEIPPHETFLDLTQSYGHFFLLSNRNSYTKWPITFGRTVQSQIQSELREKGWPTYITSCRLSRNSNILNYYDVVYHNKDYTLLKMKPYPNLQSDTKAHSFPWLNMRCNFFK